MRSCYNYCAACGAAGLLAFAPPAAGQTLTNTGATLAVAPGTTLFVGGGMLTQSAGVLANDGTVQLTGDFTLASAGSTSGNGLLRFAGPSDQTLNAPAGTTLPNVEAANTGPVGNNRLLVPANLTVSGGLLLSSGLVRTAAAAILSLPNGASLTGEAAGRYVQGNLRISRAAVPGVVDFGHGVVLDGTGQALGAVTITRTAGLQAAGLSYGTNLTASTQSIDRIWSIVPQNQPTAPVPVTFGWLADDDNGLTSFAQARAWQQAGPSGPWVPVGAPANAAARSLARSAAVLDRFTVSNAANPLPVELTLFTAERRGDDGQLRWATASEKNNAWFVVESSADGRAFQRLGQVAGHGSSAQPRAYEFRDANLTRYAAGLVYYRLRQVDAEGTETFSPVRTVAVPTLAGLALEASPVPLPTGERLSLRIRTSGAGPATLLVADALGRAVLARTLELPAGATSVALPEAAQWPQGVYVLRLRQGSQQQTVKVVRE